MEYLIESHIISCDLDNLSNCLLLLESENRSTDGIIRRIIQKIKEIWEKIKNFFTSKKMDNDIKTLESMEIQSKQIEVQMKEEAPEKLEETKERLSKKLFFEGIHIKDWVDAFKRFFKYNLDCLKKHQYKSCKGLKMFLNKKQQTIRKASIGVTLIIQVLINVYYQFKGISIQSDLVRAVDELDRRIQDKIEHGLYQSTISKNKKTVLHMIDKNHQMEDDERTYKTKRINKSYEDLSQRNDDKLKAKASNYSDEKAATLIIKSGLVTFNALSSLLASGITIVLNFIKYGKNSGKRIISAQSSSKEGVKTIKTSTKAGKFVNTALKFSNTNRTIQSASYDWSNEMNHIADDYMNKE